MAWSELIDEDVERRMVEWRRRLHKNPELSFKEFNTTEFIADLLSEWDIVSERPLPTGVVARIQGGRPGPRIAVRADIDALPITEENTFEFTSRNPGVMHACGHDGHTAILLGVTDVLRRLQPQLAGEIVLLFQPAEEQLDGGAQGFLSAGALEGVDAVLGLHLWAGLETGKVSVRSGPILASTDEFKITVHGEGGHGAYPHQTADALVAAGYLITQLQTIVSRRIDPFEPAVVTLGTIHAGTAFNVITDRAELTGTVRTASESARNRASSELERVVTKGLAGLAVTAELRYRRGNPVLVNDEGVTEIVRQAARTTLPDGAVVQEPLSMGGDDFAFLAQRVPGSYFFVGSQNADLGSDFPHHHPRFTVDEAALAIGARVLANSIERVLGTRAARPSQAPGGDRR
jgi:amidohydrolase